MKRVKIIPFIALFALMASFSACSIDNYDEPDATLKGTVIDNVTNEPLISEQPNGYRVEYKEISWSDDATLQYFWGMEDGTFQNTKLFAGDYEVCLVEGAFIDPDIQTITLEPGGTKDLTFNVTPCMTISGVSISRSTSADGLEGVKATFTLNNNVEISGTTDYLVMVSPNQYTGSNIYDPDLSSAKVEFTAEDMGSPITVEAYGNDSAGFIDGRLYYVRVAARTYNGSGRYNFSPIVEVQL